MSLLITDRTKNVDLSYRVRYYSFWGGYMETKAAQKGKQIMKRKSGIIRGKSDFFRTARYGLTLTEHRIIYYAILLGQQNGTPFEPVTVSIADFKELCELKGQSSYSAIRGITKTLTKKSVEVIVKRDGGYDLIQAPWLAAITYHAKDGTVTIKLNKELQPFFEGKPFTETEYYFLIRFTSQYAERLYELIKSHSFSKPIVDFDIEDIRKRLGVSNTLYKNFKDFRRRVLLPALKDINEYTDLDVSFPKEKRGRFNKVETVYFAVSKKKVPKLTKRVENGEFRPPLSEQEQEIFIKSLLGEDSKKLESTDKNS